MFKKRIGIIFISITAFIGIFIMPFNAFVVPDPSFSFGVQGNFLDFDNFFAENCSISLSELGGLVITTSGDGQSCYVYLSRSSNSLSLTPGNYKFGFVREQSYPFHINLFFDGVESSLSTSNASSFSLSSPATVTSFIHIPPSLNTSVQSYGCLPYLIYANDSSDGILHAFQGSIVSFFNGLKNGLLLISDSLIGVDKLPTNLGYIFLVTIGFILCIYLIDLIFKFIVGLVHGRR